MKENQKSLNGEPVEARYAFYNKAKDTINNGWQWFHRDLQVDQLNCIYQDLQSRFGNQRFDGKGVVFLRGTFVLFQYTQAGKDDNGRDHWVLLLAWLPGMQSLSDAWSVLDGVVFQHVARDKESLPETLSEFDYLPDIVKLTNEGANRKDVPKDKSRRYIEEIEKRGAVDVVFYMEQSSQGVATIETRAKERVWAS
jgi:hypothetical protein